MKATIVIHDLEGPEQDLDALQEAIANIIGNRNHTESLVVMYPGHVTIADPLEERGENS